MSFCNRNAHDHLRAGRTGRMLRPYSMKHIIYLVGYRLIQDTHGRIKGSGTIKHAPEDTSKKIEPYGRHAGWQAGTIVERKDGLFFSSSLPSG